MKLALILSLSLYSLVALAHPGHEMNDFSAGFWHPIFGLDHLIMAFGVGMWAIATDDSRKWIKPFTFVAGMIIGALLGQSDYVFSIHEYGISLSIVFIGLALAGLNIRNAWILLFVFGTFHGNAHGSEVSEGMISWQALLGFALGTGFLHALGMFSAFSICKVFGEQAGGRWLKASGIAIAGSVLFL